MGDQNSTAKKVERDIVSSAMEGVCAILGGLVVGQPHELDNSSRIRWEVGSNTAEKFRNEVFAIRDYCWCDGALHPRDEDDLPVCPPEFEHFASGVSGEWYKYLGRDTRFSREVSAEEAVAILVDCMASIRSAEQLGALVLPSGSQKQKWGWKP